MNRYFDMIIIGGGPSGLLCAWEADQAGLSYLVLEKGALVNSLYHFPDEMTFFSTSEKLEIAKTPFISNNSRPTRDEALEYYRRIMVDHQLNVQTFEPVTSVKKKEDHFQLVTEKNIYTSESVVLATGYYSQPNLINVPGEELPKVTHYYKNAHAYIGKKVAIIGAANSACDAALECWQKGADVSMIIRGSSINQRVKYWIKPNIENRIKEGSIQAYFESEVRKIEEDAIEIKTPEGLQRIPNDFVLAMTGYRPDYEFLESVGVKIKGDQDSRPVCHEEHLESNIQGLYLAGVINCGLKTHKLFIENTRDHGKRIVSHYLKQKSIA